MEENRILFEKYESDKVKFSWKYQSGGFYETRGQLKVSDHTRGERKKRGIRKENRSITKKMILLG